MHINGNFEEFSYLWCLVWVGNINNPSKNISNGQGAFVHLESLVLDSGLDAQRFGH